MNTTRRKKRTKSEVEEEIFKVALSLIEEKGFLGVTLTGIAKGANVEPSVFYKRFNTLENFLDEFVKKYDYWFSDIFQSYKGDLYSKEGIRYIFNELFSSLSSNKVMQQLLRWELADTNETTIRTARLREFHTTPLAERFDEIFKDTPVDIKAVSSLIIGGVYYLTLHRDLTTFSNIDINDKEGRDRIINAIAYLTDKFFLDLSPDSEKINIAKKLKDKGIDAMIISECTQLPLTTVEDL